MTLVIKFNKMYRHLKINSTVYAVHKKYVNKKVEGSRIQVCKVKTFYRHDEKVIPELKVVGSTAIIKPSTYKIYLQLSEAIEAIS